MSTILTTDDGTWQTTAEISDSERYARYMTSREWGVRKRPVKARSGGICERCKINASTAVHHISYTRKYHEEPEDLMDLCDACHRYSHGLSDEDPLQSRWSNDEFALMKSLSSSTFESRNAHPWMTCLFRWLFAYVCGKQSPSCDVCGSHSPDILTYAMHGQAGPGLWCRSCLLRLLQQVEAEELSEKV